MTTASMRPEWVMFGVTVGDGTVHLYASQTLNYVELEAVYDRDWGFGYAAIRERVKGVDFSGRMRDFVLVAGADYAEAFQRLFDTWAPGDGKVTPALVPPRSELSPMTTED